MIICRSRTNGGELPRYTHVRVRASLQSRPGFWFFLMPPPKSPRARQAGNVCQDFHKQVRIYQSGALLSRGPLIPPATLPACLPACCLSMKELRKEKRSQTQFQKTSATWARSAGSAFKICFNPNLSYFFPFLFFFKNKWGFHICSQDSNRPRSSPRDPTRRPSADADKVFGFCIMRLHRACSTS